MEKDRWTRAIGIPAAARRSQKPRTIVSRSSPASDEPVSQSATLSIRIVETSPYAPLVIGLSGIRKSLFEKEIRTPAWRGSNSERHI